MRPFLFGLSGVLALLVLACGQDDEPGATETPPSISIATVEPTPEDHASIRDVDLELYADTERLLQRLGSGRADADGTLYADLTGDMRDEAILPVTSDGTLGNIAYLVYTMESGHPELILTRTMDRTTASGLMMDLDEAGDLQETAGVYGNEDPLCCPSRLRVTTFQWDGTALQVAGEEMLDQPTKAKQ